jgi:hypothetical protein
MMPRCTAEGLSRGRALHKTAWRGCCCLQWKTGDQFHIDNGERCIELSQNLDGVGYPSVEIHEWEVSRLHLTLYGQALALNAASLVAASPTAAFPKFHCAWCPSSLLRSALQRALPDSPHIPTL